MPKVGRRKSSRPEGPPARSWGLEGCYTSGDDYEYCCIQLKARGDFRNVYVCMEKTWGMPEVPQASTGRRSMATAGRNGRCIHRGEIEWMESRKLQGANPNKPILWEEEDGGGLD